MARKLERPAPPYMQIARDIRGAVQKGDLAPGDRAPSVREIVQDYDVAMATANKAVRALKAEGYLRTRRGVGNVVTDESERGWSPGTSVERARRTGQVYPNDHWARILSASLVEASEQVAGALGVEVRAAVVRRERVRYRGEVPMALSTSWFDGALASDAPKLLEAERVEQGTFGYLADRLGRQVASWQDQYEPGQLSHAQAEQLDAAPGMPVVLGRNWVYDDRGDVLEYGESVTMGRVTYRGVL